MDQNKAAVGPMDLEFYQKRALNTAVFERNDYPLVALGEEVGEVMGKIAKYGRKKGMSIEEVIIDISNSYPDAMELREAVLKEMGDVLWQWAVLAKVLGFGAHEIAWSNLDKLADRQKRDVLNGEGDNR